VRLITSILRVHIACTALLIFVLSALCLTAHFVSCLYARTCSAIRYGSVPLHYALTRSTAGVLLSREHSPWLLYHVNALHESVVFDEAANLTALVGHSVRFPKAVTERVKIAAAWDDEHVLQAAAAPAPISDVMPAATGAAADASAAAAVTAVRQQLRAGLGMLVFLTA
jgi:hypothetical protein